MSAEGSKEFERYLGQSIGYGVVAGVGFAFAALMVALTYLQAKFTQMNPTSSAEFATASRSVKAGLICCGIVSAWTWSATLLQSSTAVYQNGLSGAWWYGVGGTIQIAFFSMMAAKIKMNANGATTFLQIVNARFGTFAHLMFTFFALVCAHIVSGSLVLGCAATVNALTGMPIYAANFLLPIGIAVYVIAGGLRATFVCDYVHTVILFVVLYIFVFVAYGTSPELGSPQRLWELLQEAAINNPAPGNAEGSYTTFRSNGGIVFAACTIASGFSGVFCDQGYWQRAIASKPESTTKAYMLGALSWFAIPWCFGTTMGLTARATLTNPKFPTFPYELSASQQSAGLVAPAAAVVLLGRSGAVCVLLCTFMAATSAASAELIAVSSIVVYDILGTYWKFLNGPQAVRASHISIAVFSVWMGAWSSILHAAGIDLGWLFYVQGVCLTPAVFPIAYTVTWKRLSKEALIFGTLFGTTCAMIGWMVGCYKIYGKINITNLALPYAALSGAAPGLVMSAIACPVIAYFKPGNGDWTVTRAISGSGATGIKGEEDQDMETPVPEMTKREGSEPATQSDKESDQKDVEIQHYEKEPLDRKVLQKVFIRAAIISWTLALIITIIIPMPLFGTSYQYSKNFFTAWIAFAIIWLLIAGAFCILLPVWESRKEIVIICKGGFRMITGRSEK